MCLEGNEFSKLGIGMINTTHIGVKFFKCEWKVFCEVWNNLKNSSIKQNHYWYTVELYYIKNK